MLHTDNYLLNKPENNEKVNIDLINENMDIIDRNLKSISGNVESAKMTIDFILIDQQELSFENRVCILYDPRIMSNSVADVYFTGDTISAAEKAVITAETYDNRLELTAVNIPEGVIKATIKVSNINVSDVAFSVNGKIDQFQVADGNRIKSGDFVELFTSQNINKFSDGTILKDIHNVSHNLYVAVNRADNKNNIVLFTYVNGTINLIYTYETSSFRIMKIKEGLFWNYGNDEPGFLFTVNSEKKMIEKRESFLTYKASDLAEIHKIAENKFIDLYIQSHIGPNSASIRFNFVYNIRENNEPDIETEYIYDASAKTYNFEEMYWNTIHYIGNHNNKFYFLSQQKQENNPNYYYYVQLLEFTFSDDYSSMEKRVVKTFGTSYSENTANDIRCNASDPVTVLEHSNHKFILFRIENYRRNNLIDMKTYAYNPITDETVNIYKVDGSYESYAKDYEKGSVLTISQNTWYVFPIDSPCYYIVYYSENDEKLYFYEKVQLNQIINDITINKEPTGSEDYIPAFFKLENDIVVVLNYNENYIVFTSDITNYALTLKPDIKMVKLYSDGHNPIGIARDGGEPGEMIDVYIPVKNNLSVEEEIVNI